MSRHVLAVLAGTLAVCALSTPTAAAQGAGAKGVDFPFPAKAPVVVCLNGYDTARERLKGMLATARPGDAAAAAGLLDGLLGRVFEGRALTAVRKDARAFLVLNDFQGLLDDTPAVSVLVPVTSHKGFLESFLTKAEFKSLERGADGVDAVRTSLFGGEQPAYLVELPGYTAVSLDKPTAEGYTGKYAAANSAQMGTGPAATFVASDLAVYVNMAAINEQFGDTIRAFNGLIDFGFQQAEQQGALQTLNPKQVRAVKSVLKGLVQGAEDCRAVVLGVEFLPAGLSVRLQARFEGDSPSGRWVAAEKPTALAEIGKLPQGLGTYTGFQIGGTAADLFRDLTPEFVTTEDDARGAELIEDHLKSLADAGPGAEYAAALPPGAAFRVATYRDAEKAARAISKAFKAVGPGGRVGGVVVKAAPRVSDEAETHRGFTFSSVDLSYDFAASVAGLPDAVREATLDTLKRTYPEKASQWVGSNGKVVVRVTAKDWAAAERLLDAHLDGKGVVGADAGYRRVREHLPAEANAVAVAEIESAVTGLMNALRPAAHAIPGFPRLRQLGTPAGGKPAYVGLAVTLKGDTATVTGFVPAASAEAAFKVFESVLKKVD